MDRMAEYTRQPEVLHELFEALGNDPFVIAECLARPALASVADAWSVRATKTDKPNLQSFVPATATFILPIISDTSTGCIDDSWTATSSTKRATGRFDHNRSVDGTEMIVWGGADLTNEFNTGGKIQSQHRQLTATTTVNAPSARSGHTAVWTGTEMIVWVEVMSLTSSTPAEDTILSRNSWTATSTANVPTGRNGHTAVGGLAVR